MKLMRSIRALLAGKVLCLFALLGLVAPTLGDVNVETVRLGEGDEYYVRFTLPAGATSSASTTWPVPEGVTSLRYLVVGGGGAGGSGYAASTRSDTKPDMGGGGGGAGAGFEGTVAAVSAGASVTITVGAGGIGAVSSQGGDGGASSISVGNQQVASAAGGGGGGRAINSSSPSDDSLAAGRAGGCGGGGTVNGKAQKSPKSPQLGGTSVDELHGNAGGNGYVYATGGGAYALCYGGGGGGITEAGHVGGGTGVSGPRKGGAGLTSTITGESIVYGGGGGGGGATATEGGNGGAGGGGKGGTGANGASTDSLGCGSDGVNGLGGGGGGGAGYSYDYNKAGAFAGGNGGSGVVIIRYSLGERSGDLNVRTVSLGNNEYYTRFTLPAGATESGSTTWTVPDGVTAFDFLVVGGGGGGSYGGGGAGGMVTGCVENVSGKTFTLSVGNGGAGETSSPGNGGASSFAEGDTVYVSAPGGGAAGLSGSAGSDGGSGGGGSRNSTKTYSAGGNKVLATINDSKVSSAESLGNPGASSEQYGSGGGGGAGHAGYTGTNSDGINKDSWGGEGVASLITGSSVVYAGGGNGGGNRNTAGSEPLPAKSGGGGRGGINVAGYYDAEDGTDGLGGGGGGVYGGNTGGTPGNGGNGVVILRYTIANLPFEQATVTVAEPTVVRFTGEKFAPVVTVTLNGQNITDQCQFSWGGSLIDAGLYTLTVRGKPGSEYDGKTLDAHPIFQIQPLRSTDYGDWGYTYWYRDGNYRYYVTAYTNAPLSQTANTYHPLKPYCLWQAPTGVTSVEILAVGGAGGGSGGSGSQVGGGGKGGSVYRQASFSVTEGAYYEVLLGKGGAGGVANGAGGNGEVTYLYAGTVSKTGKWAPPSESYPEGYEYEEWARNPTAAKLSANGGTGASAASGTAGANGANAGTYDIFITERNYGYGGAKGSGTAVGAAGADIYGQGGAGGGTNAAGGKGGDGTLIIRYRVAEQTRTAWKQNVQSGDWNTAANWVGDKTPTSGNSSKGAEFYMLDGATEVTVNSAATTPHLSVNNMAPLTLKINNKLKVGNWTDNEYPQIGTSGFRLPMTTLEFANSSSQLNLNPKTDAFGLHIGTGGADAMTATLRFKIPASGWTTKETAPLYDGISESPVTIGSSCLVEIDATDMTETGIANKHCLCYAAGGVRVTAGLNYNLLSLNQWLASGRVQMTVPAGKRGVIVWQDASGNVMDANTVGSAMGGIWFYLDEAIDIKDAVVTISKTTAGFTGSPVAEPTLTSVKLMVEGVLTDITESCMLVGWKDENGKTVEGSQLTTWGTYTPIVQARPEQNTYGGTVDNDTLPKFEILAAYYHKPGETAWETTAGWFLDEALTDGVNVYPDNENVQVNVFASSAAANVVGQGSGSVASAKVKTVELRGNASDASKYAALANMRLDVKLEKNRSVIVAERGTGYLSGIDMTILDGSEADTVAYADVQPGATLGIDNVSIGRMVVDMDAGSTLKFAPAGLDGSDTSSTLKALQGEGEGLRTLAVENNTVTFTGASGVEGALALQLTLGANNTTANTMLTFEGAFSVAAGSTLAVDASAKTTAGTYPLVRAGSWTGAMTAAQLASAATLTQPTSLDVMARLEVVSTGINLVIETRNEWHAKNTKSEGNHWSYDDQIWYKDAANTPGGLRGKGVYPMDYTAQVFVHPSVGDWVLDGHHDNEYPNFKVDSLSLVGHSATELATIEYFNTKYNLTGDRTICTVGGGWVKIEGCEFKFEAGSTGIGYIDVRADSTLELVGEISGHGHAALRFPSDSCGNSTVKFSGFSKPDTITLQSMTGGSTATAQTLKFQPSGTNNKGGFVQFLDATAVNGVAGSLHFDITLAQNNLDQNSVANFAGSLDLKMGSTLTVNANNLNSPGVYTLIHAGSWTGTMTIDDLVTSGNANLSGVASGLSGKVIKSADGKDVQLALYVSTVTLNANGGTGGQSSVSATYGAAMPALASLPTREHWVFLGYFDAQTDGTKYYNADGSSAKNWDKTADTTLYAQWRKLRYTIVIPVQPGITTRVAQEVEYGDEFCVKMQESLPTQVLNTWYFYKEESLSTKYTLTYSSSWTSGSGYGEATYDYINKNAEESKWSSTTYANEIEKWAMWVKNLSLADGGTVYLKANYHPRKWRVRYNENGGEGEMASQTFFYGGEPDALTACGFTRTGYQFAGWATTAGGLVVYTDQQPVKDLTQDHLHFVDLYAVWTPNTYTITLVDTIIDEISGEGGQGSVTATYDAVLPTLTKVPSKAGYTFLGYGIASFNGSTYSPILYYDANGTAVDGKKFDDSLLLVNEFRSIWKKNVAVPVGKTLTYNGALQTGVDASSEGDYTLSGHQQTAAGPYTATATLVQPTVTAALGLVERKWSDGGTTEAKSVSWSIAPKAPASLTITCADSYWTGSELTAPVVVKDGDTQLVEGRDYDLTSNHKHTSVSDSSGYTVTVTFKGNYSGTAYVNWKIRAPEYIVNVASGNWNDANTWRTVPEDYRTTYGGNEYPNGEQHLVSVTNKSYKTITLDLQGGTYKVADYIGVGANSGTVTLKNGGVTFCNSNASELKGGNRVPRANQYSFHRGGSAEWGATGVQVMDLVLENLTVTKATDATTRNMTIDSSLTMHYKGTTTMTGVQPTWYLGYWQINRFEDGVVTLNEPFLVRDQTNNRDSKLQVSNATVTAVSLDMTTSPNAPLEVSFGLGASHCGATGEAAMLAFSGAFNANANLATLTVDAGQKGTGTYTLMTAASGNALAYLAANATVTNLQPGYKAKFVTTETAGVVTKVDLKIERGLIIIFGSAPAQ